MRRPRCRNTPFTKRYFVGQVIGKLELISRSQSDDSRTIWSVVCACGNKFERRQDRFDELKHMCPRCAREEAASAAERGETSKPKRKRSKKMRGIGGCPICCGQPHRAPKPHCPRCKTPFKALPPVTVECMRSSAMRWSETG